MFWTHNSAAPSLLLRAATPSTRTWAPIRFRGLTLGQLGTRTKNWRSPERILSSNLPCSCAYELTRPLSSTNQVSWPPARICSTEHDLGRNVEAVDNTLTCGRTISLVSLVPSSSTI